MVGDRGQFFWFKKIAIFQSGENHARGYDGNSPVGCASRSSDVQTERSGPECHQVEHTSSYVLVNTLSSIS